MKLDFISGTYKGRSTAIDSQECVNFYPELSANGNAKSSISLIGTPGKKKFVDFEYGIIRGIYTTVTDRCFVATGNKLFELLPTKIIIFIGMLNTNKGRVSFSENETQLIIVDRSFGYLYYLSNGNQPKGTFNKIITEGYQAGTSVINIDRYFLQNVTGTGYFICSALGDGTTWNPIDKGSAERSPDTILTIGTVNNEAWIFGSKSTEVFYDSGAVDFPFSRINSAYINIGISAKDSLGIINNSAIWLGGNSQGYGIVWMATGYIPRRISNHAIEYLIGSFGDTSDAYAWTYQQEGHYFYILNFPSVEKTLCYDMSTDLWHERGYYNKETGLNTRDIASCSTLFDGKIYVGDYRNSKIYELDLDYYYDDETLIKRVRTGGHIHSDRKRLFFHQFELDLERGVGINKKLLPLPKDYRAWFKGENNLDDSIGDNVMVFDGTNGVYTEGWVGDCFSCSITARLKIPFADIINFFPAGKFVITFYYNYDGSGDYFICGAGDFNSNNFWMLTFDECGILTFSGKTKRNAFSYSLETYYAFANELKITYDNELWKIFQYNNGSWEALDFGEQIIASYPESTEPMFFGSKAPAAGITDQLFDEIFINNGGHDLPVGYTVGAVIPFFADLSLLTSGGNGTEGNPWNATEFQTNACGVLAPDSVIKVKGSHNYSTTNFNFCGVGGTPINIKPWGAVAWRISCGYVIGNCILEGAIINATTSFGSDTETVKVYDSYITTALLQSYTANLDIYGCSVVANSIVGSSINFIDSIVASNTVVISSATKTVFTSATMPDNADVTCQANWSSPSFPIWSAPRPSFAESILCVGITTPPQPGNVPYTGYETGLFGSTRTGIGAVYFGV